MPLTKTATSVPKTYPPSNPDDAVLNNISAFSEVSIPLILPRHRVQDIDTVEDWQRAELMFKAQNTMDLMI